MEVRSLKPKETFPFQDTLALGTSKKSIKKPNWNRTSYFKVRHKKLTEQAPSSKTKLFEGLHLYFTGVKSYSQRRLETLVWQNGGTVHRDCLRSIITHIVADNLSGSKIEKELSLNLKNHRPINILSPKWILQSVDVQRLLPTWKFQVVKGPCKVKPIDRYFRTNKPKTDKSHKVI